MEGGEFGFDFRPESGYFSSVDSHIPEFILDIARSVNLFTISGGR